MGRGIRLNDIKSYDVDSPPVARHIERVESGFHELSATTREPGTHVMFDCRGTIDLYCWDGGKTWALVDTVQDRPESWNAARPS